MRWNFKKMRWFALALVLLISTHATAALDHQHAAWTALLQKHVSWQREGVTTAVNYAAFKKDLPALNAYTAQLAAVKETEFKSFSPAQRQAFLINAYNAYTVQLIVENFPKVKSIKDLGSLLSSPWSKARYSLLGQLRSLDDIEHKLLRGAKDFNEPRIHFAVNCASIGCPALRPEAFVDTRLAAQLEEQTSRFLKDRTRNYLDRADKTLYVSSIFDWYEADFEKGFLNAKTLEQFLARYAGSLSLTNGEKQALLSGDIDIDHTDYDWQLNVLK